MTKGDNNVLDDVSLYPGERTMVSRGEVVGFVRGYIPFLGWAAIGVQEVLWVKYILYSLLAIVILGAR